LCDLIWDEYLPSDKTSGPKLKTAFRRERPVLVMDLYWAKPPISFCPLQRFSRLSSSFSSWRTAKFDASYDTIGAPGPPVLGAEWKMV